MKEFQYTIKDSLGIHARPAGLMVKEASKFKSTIKICKDEREADCKRLLAVMGLGIKKDQEVSFYIEGEDEEAACEAMFHFMRENL